ncbi:DUF3987 domain-containing protein, partial [bacterium]|nr:DUF3987 domain-containing protein [bacterium]
LVSENQRALEILEKSLKHTQTQAAKCKSDIDRSVLRAEAKELVGEIKDFKASKLLALPTLFVDDVTPEVLARLLDDNAGKLAIMSAEGGLFGMMAGRYSGDGRIPNLDVYLKSHVGDTVKIHRIARPDEYVRNPALTIGLTVQFDVLRNLSVHPSFRGRGLLGRFFYSLPHSSLGHRQLNPRTVPEFARQQYQSLIRDVLRMDFQRDDDGKASPWVFTFSPEAQAVLDTFAMQVEASLADGGTFEHLRDWAGKLAGGVARIAGVLHGLLRVRSFTQDDAHIFCTPEQYPAEIEGVFDFCCHVLDTFGFDYHVGLKTRGEKRIGSDAIWDMAEDGLRQALEKLAPGKYYVEEGDATFYGPKVDFIIKDSLGRDWQGSTIQLDFNLPERFGLEYVDADGRRKQPVMIHRAILGSFERFFGLLLEEFGGAFPLWLAPLQARVLPIGEDHLDYAQLVASNLSEHGLRVEVDASSEKLGKKIRSGKTEKIPYLIVVGANEVENGTITVESYFDGKLTDISHVDQLLERMQTEVAGKVARRRE